MRNTLTVLILSAALLLALPAAPAAAGGGAYAGLLEHYEAVRTALLHDHLDGVARHAQEIAVKARVLEADFSAAVTGVPAAEAGAVKSLLPRIAEAADGLADTGDPAAARRAFGDLSAALIRWHRLLEGGDGLAVGSCPMVEHGWLQPAEAEVGNPYMGQAMARCGDLEG